MNGWCIAKIFCYSCTSRVIRAGYTLMTTWTYHCLLITYFKFILCMFTLLRPFNS